MRELARARELKRAQRAETHRRASEEILARRVKQLTAAVEKARKLLERVAPNATPNVPTAQDDEQAFLAAHPELCR